MARGFIKGMTWGAGFGLCTVAIVSVSGNYNGATIEQQRARVAADGAAVSSRTANRAANDGPSAAGLATQEVPAPAPDTLASLLTETLKPAAVPQAGAASNLASAQAPDTDALNGIAGPSGTAPQVSYVEQGGLQTPATEPALSISSDPAQPPTPVAVPQETAFAAAPEAKAESGGAETVDPSGAAPEVADQGVPLADAPAPQIADAVSAPGQPVAPGATAEQSGFQAPASAPAAVESEIAGPSEVAATAAAPQPAADAGSVLSGIAPEVDALAPRQPSAQPAPDDSTPDLLAADSLPRTASVSEVATPAPAARNTEAGESLTAQVAAEVSVEPPRPSAFAESAPMFVAGMVAPPEEPQAAPPLASAVAREKAPDRTVDAPAEPPRAASAVEETPDESEAEAPVLVNRLPSLGGRAPDTEADGDGAGDADAAVAEENVPPEPGPDTTQSPLDRFGVAFENPEDKPLMAVILMDDGTDPAGDVTGISALKDLPYPVSFAVDALLPDAAERMRAYRKAGFEVLATVDLPQGARAGDAEVNLSVALKTLPDVVGVLDGVRTGVQTTPDAGRQVAQILAQSGHGFVTQNRGLNTVQKLAARQGVPSAVVFRDFDAKGQSDAVMRRFLDQAAFRAGQEGGVVMLGRLRDETINALLLWALQDRASSVAMAPVSAVLRAQ